jgi:hypothetical protein
MNANQAFTSPPPPQEEKLQKLTEKWLSCKLLNKK